MSPNPPRVVHLVCPASTGGVETVVRLLAGARHRLLGHTSVIAITSGGDTHPFVTELRDAGVPVVVRAPRGRRYFAEAREIASLLREMRVDVVHTHVYRADYIGYLAARRASVPAVSTFHGETGGDRLNRLYEWSVKRLFQRFDAIVCVSLVNRDKLRIAGSDLRNAHVVPNAIELGRLVDRDAARRELGLADSGLLVGWVGRLSHEKGPDLMLDAFARAHSTARLVFVGEGPMRPALEEQAAARGILVTFAGAIRGAGRVLRAFDVVAMSGRMEGMPMVMLEAMRAEVPVAGFLVGGIPEVLSSATGWPAAPENTDALGSAVSAALNDRPAAAVRAAAANALVQRDYGVERWVEAHERVYAAAMRRR